MGKPKYQCFLCGVASENGPGFCAVNFHDFGVLTLNEKQRGYSGFFQKGFAHLTCLEEHFSKTDDERCTLCDAPINVPQSAMKLAMYIYRIPGCYRVLSVHEACFRKAKCEDFFLIRSAG